MKQRKYALAFLLVILSASIVTTGIFLGWFGTKSTSPSWQKIGNDIDGEKDSEKFGSSVSLSSDRAIKES